MLKQGRVRSDGLEERGRGGEEKMGTEGETKGRKEGGMKNPDQ